MRKRRCKTCGTLIQEKHYYYVNYHPYCVERRIKLKCRACKKELNKPFGNSEVCNQECYDKMVQILEEKENGI